MSNILYIILVLSVICNVFQFYFPMSDVAMDRTGGNVRRALAEANIVAGVVLQPHARKIFIDLGANDGQSTSFFLQKDGLGGGIATQGGGDGSIMQGLGSTGDWEIFMFEANLNFTSQLTKLKDDIMEKKMAKNVTLYGGTAIAKTTGPLTFIMDNPFSGSAGATTMPESTSAVGPHSTIPAVGIVDLFHSLRIHHSDFVVLKMDIEGAEFELMRHILTHGVQSRIDILAVEYHDQNYWVFGKDDKTREKYKALHTCLDWMVEDLKGMKVVNWGRR